MLVSYLPFDIWAEIILNFDVDLPADQQALQNIALCCRDLSYFSYKVLFKEVTYWWPEPLGPWFTDGAKCNARVKNLTIWQHPINGSEFMSFSGIAHQVLLLQGLWIGDCQDIFLYLQLAHINESSSKLCCFDLYNVQISWLNILAIPSVFPSLEAISVGFIQFQDYLHKDHAIFHKLSVIQLVRLHPSQVPPPQLGWQTAQDYINCAWRWIPVILRQSVALPALMGVHSGTIGSHISIMSGSKYSEMVSPMGYLPGTHAHLIDKICKLWED
ncbi:hypothetical protein ARMGADRAFT_1035337 [Armillaria gallica]|uniref:Uncharacterized protein n=1 Tax=Armillaria gallica TaxID=47427 RepID=A0A2H3D7H4_ARMGA|nr:hypothetical protein ARMGADRAFT_1035337 [Armillaria gallica]